MPGKRTGSDKNRLNNENEYNSDNLYSSSAFPVMDSKMCKFSARFLMAFIPYYSHHNVKKKKGEGYIK